MTKRHLIIAAAAAGMLVGGAAIAQTNQSSTASGQSLSELRQEARRLTLLADLPEAARADAQALFDRADTLRSSSQDLDTQRLQAYVAALQAGDSASVATQEAAAKVSDASVALARQVEEFDADVAAFFTANPTAGNALRASLTVGRSGQGRGPSAGFGGFGRGFGGPAAGGSGHGAGAGHQRGGAAGSGAAGSGSSQQQAPSGQPGRTPRSR